MSEIPVSFVEATGAGQPEPRSGVVLVVDDQKSVRETVCEFLKNAGYYVLRAENGREALAIASEAERIDLVITDMLMPEVDGVELIRSLRRTLPDVRIFAMSGGGQISAELCLSIARRIGADRVREKPIG